MSNATATETTAFIVGRTYQCRSVCDYDCVYTFTVVSRTAKFVTLVDTAGETRRVGVRNYCGRAVECCSPHGTYSMAALLVADRDAA